MAYAGAYNFFSDNASVSFMQYKREFLAAIITALIISSFLYISARRLFPASTRLSGYLTRFYDFFDKRALLALVVTIILLLIWARYLIFTNPFLCEYNHGNGAYYVQVLHNLSSGIGPEESVKSTGSLFYTSNPYFYTSIFSVTAEFLHIFLLVPLYRLYPFPPMHVFAVVILVFSLGALGVYWAIREAKGSRVLSLFGAIGYCLLPWVTMPIFFVGAFDNLGFVIYPYVFAALFSKRWVLFYFFLTLLGLINIPYAYSVMAIGIISTLFFKARSKGVIASLIGLAIAVFGMIIVRQSLRGLYESAPTYTDLFGKMILNHETIFKAVSYHLVYLSDLFFTVAFIPFLCVRRKKKWNMEMLGLFLFLAVGFFMGLFRSYYWFLHRASNFVVPVYLCGFLAYTSIKNDDFYFKPLRINASRLAGILMFSTLTSVTLWFSWQYPWAEARHLISKKGFLTIANVGKASIIKPSPNNVKFAFILSKIKEFVPPEAALAYRVDSGIEAFLANRQKAWQVGCNPEGVEYYVIQSSEIESIRDDYPGWQELLKKIKVNKGFLLLYHDDKIDIYKNISPVKIPRFEDNLGWDTLLIWRDKNKKR